VATAWLTAMHDFPGRRFFEWALVLPLAVPAYVMAYVYTDFLQFVGPVQTLLRETFGWQHGDYWFPDIRTLPGAILMFVSVLYPMFTCSPAPPSSSAPAACSKPRGRWAWAVAGLLYRFAAAGPAGHSSPALRWR
jgi:hypothetical protein